MKTYTNTVPNGSASSLWSAAPQHSTPPPPRHTLPPTHLPQAWQVDAYSYHSNAPPTPDLTSKAAWLPKPLLLAESRAPTTFLPSYPPTLHIAHASICD
ncbi:hypothetical protein E2C01_049284 [Portunus trituberculatus]|uniref:Uncharacterized protein n=1 Tax=Portunus trituberculatus TaxID=210409 RepID=A0A5B7G5S5_PORTR|nr:hypothetical protein [Portunus trituberculatus]